MVSQRKLLANRRNARKSTGPRTANGKAASAANAVSHGIFARPPVLPGLGETRRKALLAHFGSLKRLADATPEEIAAVPGIGPRTAEAIRAALHGDISAGVGRSGST